MVVNVRYSNASRAIRARGGVRRSHPINVATHARILGRRQGRPFNTGVAIRTPPTRYTVCRQLASDSPVVSLWRWRLRIVSRDTSSRRIGSATDYRPNDTPQTKRRSQDGRSACGPVVPAAPSPTRTKTARRITSRSRTSRPLAADSSPSAPSTSALSSSALSYWDPSSLDPSSPKPRHRRAAYPESCRRGS